MKRATLLIALLALSAPAIACMGYLVRSDYVNGGMLCTYQLTNGQNVQLVYPGAHNCPLCLE